MGDVRPQWASEPSGRIEPWAIERVNEAAPGVNRPSSSPWERPHCSTRGPPPETIRRVRYFAAYEACTSVDGAQCPARIGSRQRPWMACRGGAGKLKRSTRSSNARPGTTFAPAGAACKTASRWSKAWASISLSGRFAEPPMFATEQLAPAIGGDHLASRFIKGLLKVGFG